jgi:glutamyl-Q tRNA(Asp) synthetase
VLGHAHARASGGKFLLRIEDLDQSRCRPEYVEGIFEDLEWLGLTVGGGQIVQSERTGHYQRALDQLKAGQLVYACFCTRSEIAQSLTAPHGDAGSSYSGRCRPLPDDPERRATTPHCWRLNAERALEISGLPNWVENDGALFESKRSDFGDAILARKDAPSSYHLACVVDDAASGVNFVVRGEDLRPSTPTQRLLQSLLDLPEPIYLHHPLVTHEDGRRLAKRDLAPTLAAMRKSGVDGPSLAAQLLEGQLPLGFRLSEA